MLTHRHTGSKSQKQKLKSEINRDRQTETLSKKIFKAENFKNFKDTEEEIKLIH